MYRKMFGSEHPPLNLELAYTYHLQAVCMEIKVLSENHGKAAYSPEKHDPTLARPNGFSELLKDCG